MPISCDIDDERWIDYRERIAISDGAVKCCETGVRIPEGFPYALCEGRIEGEGFDSFPQALEIWRLLRNASRNEGHCLYFAGAHEQLSYEGPGDDGYMLLVRFESTRKRIKNRYAEGKKPRLTVYEKASLESGEWADWIAWHDGYGRIFTGRDKQTREERDCSFGKAWVPIEDEESEELVSDL